MDLTEIKTVYEENEVKNWFGDDGRLYIEIKTEMPVGRFVPIAKEYWELYSELEGVQDAVVVNELGDTSEEFYFNLDSELE